MRILLVEDDPSLGESVQSWLQLDGYAVDWVQRGDEGETALKLHHYDAVLLDRGLPALSGDMLLKHLRQHDPHTPVLMITARDTLTDRVNGLDLGADDYLVKPFDLEELSARLRAALRRGGSQQGLSTLQHGPIELDPASKQVLFQGTPVTLTAREYAVLHALMLNKPRLQSRAQLEEALYGWGDEVESNTVEVHIHHLRKKFGRKLIRTVRGMGYMLSDTTDAPTPHP